MPYDDSFDKEAEADDLNDLMYWFLDSWFKTIQKRNSEESLKIGGDDFKGIEKSLIEHYEMYSGMYRKYTAVKSYDYYKVISWLPYIVFLTTKGRLTDPQVLDLFINASAMMQRLLEAGNRHLEAIPSKQIIRVAKNGVDARSDELIEKVSIGMNGFYWTYKSASIVKVKNVK